MLPVERQARIRELIHVKKNLKISELSAELNVSEMTIHRDLKPLIEDGTILKTFGGISLAKSEPEEDVTDPDSCVICMRSTNDKLAYRLILANGKIEMTCCAHCGLIRHRQLGDDVIQAIAHDFFRQTTVSAPLMHYVFDTSIDMGCCQPQVLTFEHKDHANRFVKGFEGNVFSFTEAMEEVYKRMNHHSCCSSHR